MTFNQIKYFVTLAECLSYTEAAKCLFITQPALSRQIAAMEEELGTQLLIRNKKNVRLTPGGSVLYNHFRKIQEDYNQAIEEAKSANTGFEGSLRLGVLDIYDTTGGFLDIISDFRKAYPKINVSLSRGALGQLPRMLQEQKVDVIVTMGFSLFDQPDIMCRDVESFSSVVMLPKNHPLANQNSVRLEDLREDTFILLSARQSEEGARYIDSLFLKSGFYPNVHWVDRMEDAVLWVQMGDGISITTDNSIEKYNPNVVLKPIELEESKNHQFTLAWKKGNYNPAIALLEKLW